MDTWRGGAKSSWFPHLLVWLPWTQKELQTTGRSWKQGFLWLLLPFPALVGEFTKGKWADSSQRHCILFLVDGWRLSAVGWGQGSWWLPQSREHTYSILLATWSSGLSSRASSLTAVDVFVIWLALIYNDFYKNFIHVCIMFDQICLPNPSPPILCCPQPHFSLPVPRAVLWSSLTTLGVACMWMLPHFVNMYFKVDQAVNGEEDRQKDAVLTSTGFKDMVEWGISSDSICTVSEKIVNSEIPVWMFSLDFKV